VIEQFKKFIGDTEAHECYITGVAGTGKTTSLAELITWCHDNKLIAVTCAFTHKAVGVLRSKLPAYAYTCTLHSYLQKRPTINDKATKITHVEGNAQVGIPDKIDILFVDEFSMIGERDYMDIAALQYNDDGDIVTKVVYIGDPNQLPPVKDQQTINPKGDYWIKLTKIHRQSNDNPLIDTLLQLNDYINGKKAVALTEHSTFSRGNDIVEMYKADRKSKILLAYTNAQVEFLNAQVQGRAIPLSGDEVFSPTMRKLYVLEKIANEADYIVGIRGDIIELNSKYKTLETLHEIEGVQFFLVKDEDDNFTNRAVVFGHDTFLQLQQNLAKKAVAVNKEIERIYKVDPKQWSQQNWQTDLAKKRQKAWKHYLAVKDNVICMDFAHAMTVHKSQGSTYEHVYLDIEDIGKCADNDYSLYLKLLYVGISRASKKVFTN